jgi:hypothetical protein
MVVSLLLVLAALRLGLQLRRARAARRAPPAGARAAHLRLARPALVCIGAGLLAGPASAVWLRGWEPLATFHGAVGVIAAGLFAAVALHGRRLERGMASARAAHAAFAALAILAAGVAAVAGFVLLP